MTGTPRRLLVLLLAHSVLAQVITFVLRPAVTYRAIELDVPGGWLGALAASFAVVPLLLAVPSGQATDRFGERRVMIAGALLMTASAAILLLTGTTAAGLAAGIAVLGTGHLLCVVGQQAAVANAAPPEKFDTAFGHYTFAASLGQALGPVLITLTGGGSAVPDTTTLFAASIALGLTLTVSALLLRTPARPTGAREQETGGMRTLVRLPGLPQALLVSCVVLAAVDITLVYLPALGTDRGLTAGFVGLLLTLRAAASMTSRLFLGRLVPLLGRQRLMIVTTILSATSMAALALPLPPAALACLVVALGLGLGVGQPLTMAWLAASTPPGLRGRAMSLRLTGNRLGQVVLPSAVGALAVTTGAAGVLCATAAALAAVAPLARRPATDQGT
ncbi:MFS transporter [Lentzea sp. NPDC058450]|uniref:MFS transporter n=1 Tax=Lentzea sp. NPDC058450 TaxID=3346505 RepID=UPI0036623031